jgi:bifunctional non-homologous end joining protein LigD
MAGHYLPMLADTANGPFSSDDWLFEIKWDGVRAIATVGKTITLRSRNDTELSGRFPELAELLMLAPGTVLDGEIVVMTGGEARHAGPSPAAAGEHPAHGCSAGHVYRL